MKLALGHPASRGGCLRLGWAKMWDSTRKAMNCSEWCGWSFTSFVFGIRSYGQQNLKREPMQLTGWHVCTRILIVQETTKPGDRVGQRKLEQAFKLLRSCGNAPSLGDRMLTPYLREIQPWNSNKMAISNSSFFIVIPLVQVSCWISGVLIWIKLV